MLTVRCLRLTIDYRFGGRFVKFRPSFANRQITLANLWATAIKAKRCPLSACAATVAVLFTFTMTVAACGLALSMRKTICTPACMRASLYTIMTATGNVIATSASTKTAPPNDDLGIPAVYRFFHGQTTKSLTS